MSSNYQSALRFLDHAYIIANKSLFDVASLVSIV